MECESSDVYGVTEDESGERKREAYFNCSTEVSEMVMGGECNLAIFMIFLLKCARETNLQVRRRVSVCSFWPFTLKF